MDSKGRRPLLVVTLLLLCSLPAGWLLARMVPLETRQWLQASVSSILLLWLLYLGWSQPRVRNSAWFIIIVALVALMSLRDGSAILSRVGQ